MLMLASLLLCPALLPVAAQSPSSAASATPATSTVHASSASNATLGTYTLAPLEYPSPGSAVAYGAQAANGLVVGFSVSSFSGVVGPILPTVWKNGLLTPLPLPSGTHNAYAFAVNASGTIVGMGLATGGQRAFVSDGTAITLLRPLFGTDSTASDINDLGVSVGASSDPNGATAHTAVAWTPFGDPIRLGAPIFGDSHARAINDANDIVGDASVASGFDSRPFAWSKGKFRFLPLLPGDFAGIANDVNDSGVIVGQCGATKFQSHAVVWENGVAQALPIPTGLDYSVAWAINDRGAIVGVAGTSANAARPFLSLDGQFVFLADLAAPVAGFLFSGGEVDIDEAGRIVGTGKHNGHTTAFAMTPP